MRNGLRKSLFPAGFWALTTHRISVEVGVF
jgi:hypothetical protein